MNNSKDISSAAQLSAIRTAFAWASYPLVIVLGMGFAIWMAGNIPSEPGAQLITLSLFGSEWALYEDKFHQYLMYLLPVVLSGLWVYLMERWQPFSSHWRPEWKSNIASDLGLFFLNNVLLRAEVFVAIAMAAAAGTLANWFGLNLWPQDWPLVFQILLFLVLAEFMTYWLHRLEHESFFFWRIHCVHHNPEKLYWLNATRFHYIDIIAIPVLANLPAVAMGADSLVIYLATTFSVMHGFWQHGNVNVRFGWLNYIVSSPELHRWHHMKDTKLANHNYGSNLIIWDLVFGTWFLPKATPNAQAVGVTGVDGNGVFKQLALPFTLKSN
ncbi:MAG: sterol desaturase family protein [Pseudomonadales bacterium]|nr:sterol desaturase family protein [Pseudomonadales bacterium]